MRAVVGFRDDQQLDPKPEEWISDKLSNRASVCSLEHGVVRLWATFPEQVPGGQFRSSPHTIAE